ncbi:hypothetical protein FPV67DRAFT_237183 [Lyophyllum atratum]|nr:hypothetical protein FPV67DRAFT_237183 [Lyophyllum atratum]
MFNLKLTTSILSLLLMHIMATIAVDLPRVVRAMGRADGEEALLRKPIAARSQSGLFARQNVMCDTGEISVPCDVGNLCCLTQRSIVIPSITPADTTTTTVIVSTLSIPSGTPGLITSAAFGPTIDPSIRHLSGPDGPSSTSIFGFPDGAMAVGVPSTLLILVSFVGIILAHQATCTPSREYRTCPSVSMQHHSFSYHATRAHSLVEIAYREVTWQLHPSSRICDSI